MMDRWMGGWVGGLVYGRMDGWIDRATVSINITSIVALEIFIVLSEPTLPFAVD
jgi:hypothetical protein